MDVVEFRPAFEQYAFTFGGVAPVRRVTPGTALQLWSDDAFCGALRSATDLSSDKVDLRYVNPQSGPFYVEGAEPGDTLALHLVSLEPARDWGASAHIPFFGGMTSTDRVVTLQDALPDLTYIYELDRARSTVTFIAQRGQMRVDLPLEPMLGTVGVASATHTARRSAAAHRRQARPSSTRSLAGPPTAAAKPSGAAGSSGAWSASRSTSAATSPTAKPNGSRQPCCRRFNACRRSRSPRCSSPRSRGRRATRC